MTKESTEYLFENWVAKIRPKLVRTAYSILKDEDSADDIAQETLIAVWKKYNEGTVENLSTYANRAVWINAIKYRSRNKSRFHLDFDELHLHGIAEPSTHDPHDDDSELSPYELEKAILDLPVDQQVVIRLRFYGNLSFREIGSTLSISLNTAASRCRYAIASLRQAFKINFHRENYHGKRK
jgi:RNA polymerase sigma factor (sigma-70 family)